MSKVTIEELRIVPQFRDLPDETLQWILDKSRVKTYEADEVITKTGDSIDDMWILLSGRYDFYWDTNGQLNYIKSWRQGDIGGLLPYSRMKSSPGYTISIQAGKGILLHKQYFDEMERRFPALVKRLIEILTDRVREFTASHQQQEKMGALGRMSAGLAHELNNPASAIQRSAAELNHRLISEIDRVFALILLHPEKEQIFSILLTMQEKAANPSFNSMSTIEKAKLEDELIDRLGMLDVGSKTKIAETFADIGVSPGEIDEIIETLNPDTVENILLWIENIITSERLVIEIQKASSRISQLVNSVKSYVHMDRSPTMQPTDVREGLNSTLVLLNHKIRQKNIQVKKNIAGDIPLIQAIPGDLNQVWTNIIDNAIDAMDDEGVLTITTGIERNMVMVSIADTGHGIPPDVLNKIFDPFFTTKSVGVGIGLGLDLVRGIITKHNGEIGVRSEPGKTEFTVCFPIDQKSHIFTSSEGKKYI
jgi:signal transduction histidine kinase